MHIQTSNGNEFAGVNHSVRYLFRKHKNESSDINIDQWLEWETSVFQPALLRTISSIPSDDNDLQAPLKHLNQYGQLTNNENLTSADVCLWATLSLLDDTQRKKLLNTYPNISKWYNDRAISLKSFVQKFQDMNIKKEKTSGKTDKTNSQQEIASKPKDDHQQQVATKAQKQPKTGDQSAQSSKKKEKTQQQHQTENKKDVNPAAVAPDEFLFTQTSEQIEASIRKWNINAEILSTINPNEKIKPKSGVKNVLVTSALPYVNNVPHLGNLIGSLLSADVFARYCRIRGYNTLSICGTDEYGTTTETKALEEGCTPQQICDKYYKLHCEIYDWFQIKFDYFGRTSTKKQTEIAQDIFWKLHNQGYILKDKVEQLYCAKCKRFLADRYVAGTCPDPKCKFPDARGDQCDKCGKLINAVELIQPTCQICKNSPEIKQSDHLFLDLPKLSDTVRSWFEKSVTTGHWTNTAKTITEAWLNEGLKPRCISRDLKWGTPVPLEGYTDKVFYVWFDAPIGYISITANYTDEWKQWWHNPEQVELYQFMAKDNVPFHSVIFPSCLLGTNDNYTIVGNLSGIDYLNYEDAKFSKSRGLGVFGDHAKDTDIPVDIWRFYLLYIRPETQDSTFSWEDLAMKNNSELLNNLGNFVNRGLSFCEKIFNGQLPEIHLDDLDRKLIAQITHELELYTDVMDKTRLRDGLKSILKMSGYGNKYLQLKTPWIKCKGTEDEKKEAGTTISVAINLVYLLSVLLEPYMPLTSLTIEQQLNISHDSPKYVVDGAFHCYLKPGHKIGQAVPLFKRIEKATVEQLRQRFSGKQ
ncbi:unnamed protein product [Didymodactylos carnosus]|uniref:Methionine--tRNA ligase, cytoplasmic n=1 Tax=Didymodactylos carnosus TaxID=1234261 RepID=A0A8S2E9H9_9BILA|nr:unnamed protein product [Didymodactylos carnosus]CAF3950334.1 unnamed protein product [Didymodactylos carnosus]